MFRKTISATLLAAMALTALAGCSGKSGSQTNSGSSTGGSASSTKKEKVLRYNMGADPRYMDPALMTDLVAFSAENQLFEGLVRITAKGNEPGMAASWDEKDGGLTYVFHLRDGLKWSNGDPLTADDFVFAWQRALDPKFGSEYSYQLYYVKGGEALNSIALKTKGADGKEVDDPTADQKIAEAKKNLGVKAVDAKTLEVHLEAPTPYFLGLTAFPTLMPVDSKVVKANPDWATKAETYVSNGPFKMTSWEHKNQMVMEKNPNYWDAANVKLDKLQYFMVEDLSTALNMYETGQLEIDDGLPPAELARLRSEGKLQSTPSFGTYYYDFNNKVKPFDDVRVRKALSLAIDRKALVDNVVRGGQKPAYAFVAPGALDADGKDFRVGGGDYFKEDVAQAKKLLADAGYADGKGFPEITFWYNTSDAHKAIIEAIIEMWKKNLGITSIKAANTEWKVVLDKRHKGDYQLARSGWYGDYLDPMTFLDQYPSEGAGNDVFYNNPKYDQLIATAKKTTDAKARMQAMHDAEKVLMDDMAVLPLYYYVTLYVQSDKVTGVYRNALGLMDLKTADMK